MFKNYRYTAPKEASSYGILVVIQNVCWNKCNLYQKNVPSYTSLVNDFWTKNEMLLDHSWFMSDVAL